MKHELIELPYKRDSLDPYMSEETINYHYGKHHLGYVNMLNSLIIGTRFEDMSLEDIILHSEWKVFNNAAQIWNHNLFWMSLKKDSILGEGNLLDMIYRAFGGMEGMKAEFKKHATGQFGSGWTWLVEKDGTLEIYSTPNGENPLIKGWKTLLWLDVWEHAYYLDYRNDRGQYVDTFWSLVNWEVIESRI